ncbi:MAG TPA: hypothetical protein VNP95_10695 [Thermomicrobiales bacterium]|nr:hypothetical protein [Thermomicrobiales bacterium]
MTGKPDHRDRERFWIGVQEDLARLKQNPAAWQDYQDELAFLDRSAGDGLQDEPPYYTPEEEQAILA